MNIFDRIFGQGDEKIVNITAVVIVLCLVLMALMLFMNTTAPFKDVFPYMVTLINGALGYLFAKSR